MVVQTFAPEVRDVAERIIPECHPHLLGVRIEYVFRAKAMKHRDKRVMGRLLLKRGLDALLATPGAESTLDAPPFFVVEIAGDIWPELPPDKQEALLDHELSHAGTEETDDGGVALYKKSHDLEEFEAVVRRRGLWLSDISRFVESLGQQTLFDIAEAMDA